MTITGILTGILALMIGGVAGWLSARHHTELRYRERIEALELALADCRREMAQYRTEVSRHFEQTAGLFTNVTVAYRELHHHLANGYEKLTGAPKRNMLLEAGDGRGWRNGHAVGTPIDVIAYGADTPLMETAGEDDDLDEAARHELDLADDEGELPPGTAAVNEESASATPDEGGPEIDNQTTPETDDDSGDSVRR